MSTDIYQLFDEDTNDLVTLDDIKRAELLDGVEQLGMVEAAAAEIGLTLDDVINAVDMDPRLETDINIAKGKYKASILRRMSHLAFEGSPKHVFAGKNRDIPYQDIIPNDKAMELVAKMQFSDELALVTRQRITADVKESGRPQVGLDVSLLPRKDREKFDDLMKKAHDLSRKKEDKLIAQSAKLIDKVDGE